MAQITLDDLSLRDVELTPRVSSLKDAYFRAVPEICIERPRLITRYSVDNGLFDQERISILDKARTYRYVLENRTPVVGAASAYDKGMAAFAFQENSLFAGSTTSKFKGVPMYPEFLGLSLWPELWTITERASNPFHITDEEVEELNHEIYPHWMDNNITELARVRSFADNEERLGLKKHAPELKLLERLVFFLAGKPQCISHTIPDFTRAINEGLRAVIEDASERGARATDPAQIEFYAAIGEAMEGIIGYARNLAAHADVLAQEEADPIRRKELAQIAEIYRHVPESPARTFREGLTTVWVCWVALHLENSNAAMSLGRLDQILYDLYRRDIDTGAMTIGDAVELLSCLWLKIGDHVPMVPDAGEQLFGGAGSNQAITIGGVDQDGSDAVNDLTYVILRATELIKLRDPNLNARYYSGVNEPAYLRRLCEANINTGATPALHNDKAIITALTAKGETLEQARDYGVIGCVEPGSCGRSYGMTSAVLLNLTSALELTLYNGRHRHTGDELISIETGDPTTFSSYEAFQTAFERQVQWLIDQSTTLNNLLGRVHQDYYPTPILSALFEGPMDVGRGVIEGGAVINSSGAAIIGLADVTDSLSAIERVVFDEQQVSFAELLDALNHNFVGHEALHQRLLNPDKTPKYGNEDPAADANVSWVVRLLDRAFGEKENYRGGRYRVAYWSMTNHAGFGRLMQAFPNGRVAHDNFASGITPVSGVTPYLTQALNSVANQPAACLSGGVALNLKYAPVDGDVERTLDSFSASVEGYFDDDEGRRDGGMEIQFNVTTHDTFVDAVAHPEKYPELLVRVSGYTAYFKDLNPQMQKEIIDRTEYQLSTGKMVRFDPFPLPEGSD